MKKIGLLMLALVFALGALGVGYAHWSDQLYIEGEIETGEVLVGFVWNETDDDNDVWGAVKAPDTGIDPVNPTEIPECAPCPPNPEGKDVAETICYLQNQKTHCDGTPAQHDGVPQYETILIDMDNVYPGYNPSVYFDIANCGTIPVNIVGAWIISIGGVPLDPPDWIPLPKCTPIQIDLDGDGDDDVAIGFTGPDEPQQIDPCDVEEFDLHFMFKQTLDECTDYEFEIKIAAVQWNKTMVWPDDFMP